MFNIAPFVFKNIHSLFLLFQYKNNLFSENILKVKKVWLLLVFKKYF